MTIYIILFLGSLFFLFLASSILVKSLIGIAKFLDWKEFVVSFVVMAFAGSLPSLFLGINSALHKIPELSFGEIVSGNLADLTLVIALATLISGGIHTKSKLVQSSSLFTMIIAIFPLLLILDGVLGRGDALVLIMLFILYIFWMFSKKERFSKIYEEEEEDLGSGKKFKSFLKDIFKFIFGCILLLLATEGLIRSAIFFSGFFNISLTVFGILVIGIFNCLPEMYFSIVSAREGKGFLVLGNLMGSVAISASLVLGVVALIRPIEVTNFSPFVIARFFLIISASFFLVFVRTDRKITKKEALFLLFIYIAFIVSEIVFL